MRRIIRPAKGRGGVMTISFGEAVLSEASPRACPISCSAIVSRSIRPTASPVGPMMIRPTLSGPLGSSDVTSRYWVNSELSRGVGSAKKLTEVLLLKRTVPDSIRCGSPPCVSSTNRAFWAVPRSAH